MINKQGYYEQRRITYIAMTLPIFMPARFIFLLCLLLGSVGIILSAVAQQRCLTIRDSATRQPVPYATVYLPTVQTGTYADEGGSVCIDKGTHSVIVSSVGYVADTWLVQEGSDTIFLIRKTTVLNEVIIRKRKEKSSRNQLGYRNKNLLSENSYNPNGGYRLATFIAEDGHKAAKIQQLICELTSHKKGVIDTYKIRLRLYANDPITQLPGYDLLLESVVIDVPKSAKNLVADVAKYSVYVPINGFWISVESVGYFVGGTYYPINDRRYGKNLIGDESKKVGALSPAYLFVKAGPKKSAISRWGGRWTYERYMPDMAFCFSAIVED